MKKSKGLILLNVSAALAASAAVAPVSVISQTVPVFAEETDAVEDETTDTDTESQPDRNIAYNRFISAVADSINSGSAAGDPDTNTVTLELDDGYTTLTRDLVITEDMTLDLGGNDLYMEDGTQIRMEMGSTICNGTIIYDDNAKSEGVIYILPKENPVAAEIGYGTISNVQLKVSGSEETIAVRVGSNTEGGAAVQIQKGTVIQSEGYGVICYPSEDKPASAVVQNSEIMANYLPLSKNGNYDDGTFTVWESTITCTDSDYDAAIYISNPDNANVIRSFSLIFHES